ncbi:hypothetical protein L9Z73_14700, partial [Pseudomonas sp. TNT11]
AGSDDLNRRSMDELGVYARFAEKACLTKFGQKTSQKGRNHQKLLKKHSPMWEGACPRLRCVSHHCFI